MADISILPAPDRERLCKLCGMLASPYDGERANAARMATELLQRHKLTWSDLIASPAMPSAGSGCSTASEAAFALRHLPLLTDWEQQFIRDVAGKANVSPKQAALIAKIADKIRQALAG